MFGKRTLTGYLRCIVNTRNKKANLYNKPNREFQQPIKKENEKQECFSQRYCDIHTSLSCGNWNKEKMGNKDEGLESDSTTIEGAFWRKSVWILMNAQKMKFTQNTWQTLKI